PRPCGRRAAFALGRARLDRRNPGALRAALGLALPADELARHRDPGGSNCDVRCNEATVTGLPGEHTRAASPRASAARGASARPVSSCVLGEAAVAWAEDRGNGGRPRCRRLPGRGSPWLDRAVTLEGRERAPRLGRRG